MFAVRDSDHITLLCPKVSERSCNILQGLPMTCHALLGLACCKVLQRPSHDSQGCARHSKLQCDATSPHDLQGFAMLSSVQGAACVPMSHKALQVTQGMPSARMSVCLGSPCCYLQGLPSWKVPQALHASKALQVATSCKVST